MELFDLENAWKENNHRLENTLRLNDMLIFNIMKQAKSSLMELVGISELGKNLALVYFLISMYFSFKAFPSLEYSVPSFIGGLLMLWSFFHHHRPVMDAKNLDFNQLSVLDLQKKIRAFRIHSIDSAKYDFGVVIIWFFTLTPVILMLFYDIELYASGEGFLFYCIALLLLCIILTPLNKKIYNNIYEKRLKNAEDQLKEIIDFQME